MGSWCKACDAESTEAFYDSCASWNNMTSISADSVTGSWCREQCGCMTPKTQSQKPNIPSWCKACDAESMEAFYDSCASWNNMTSVTADSVSGSWCREQCDC